MNKLKIKVENGETVVSINGEVILNLTSIELFCEGNNHGDDDVKIRFSGPIFGANTNSTSAKIELEIDEKLATAFKN